MKHSKNLLFLTDDELLDVNGGAIPALVILALKVAGVIFSLGAISGGCEAASK